MLNDFRYAIRMLLKTPTVTTIVVVSLAIGIGANTAIFNLIDVLLLRPPNVDNPSELVAIYNRHPPDTLYGQMSFPDYMDFESRNTVFTGIMAYISILPLGLNAGGQADRIYGQLVSGNYFSVLGVQPVLGRGFLPAEDRVPGASPVAVISYRLWQNQFHADPEIIGKQVKLNGHSFTLVGVAPKQFRGMFPGFFPDVWVPLMMQAQLWPGSTVWLNDRAERPLFLMARLRYRVSIETARAELTTLARQIEQAYPETNKHQGVTLLPERENRPWPTARRSFLGYLGLLLAMVTLVWLIACSNVANLLLAAGHARQREIGIRQALGAGRGRLIRQMLTESVLLALLGGLLGLLVATWTTDLLLRFRPINYPGLLMEFDLNPDGWSFAYMVVLTLLTGVICGLVPAFRASRVNVTPVLKGQPSPSGDTFRKISLRDLLVTVQVALSVLLLISAGLLTRTLRNARNTDLGFDAKNLLVMEFDLNPNGYDESRGRLFYQQLLERVGSLPGVKSLSVSQWIPLSGFGGWSAVQVDGYTPPSSEPLLINVNTVGPRYFETMGIPIVEGRDFTDQDRKGAAGVAIVNQAMSRRFWSGSDPVNRRVKLGDSPGSDLQIIGMASDSKTLDLREQPVPFIYVPFLQNYTPWITLNVRTTQDARNLISAVRQQVKVLDEDLPVFNISTLAEQLDATLYQERLSATLFGLFSLLGLLLALVGLYAVVSYAVRQRTHEIGIRAALGAQKSEILKVIMGRGIGLVLLGTAAGFGAALASTRLISGLLFGVTATDVPTYGAVCVLIVAVSLLACYIPARRATKVDPMVALRHE